MRLNIKLDKSFESDRYNRKARLKKNQNLEDRVKIYSDFCSIDVPDSITVLKLKREIRHLAGYGHHRTKNIHLIYMDSELKDYKNVSDYGVEDGDNVIIYFDILGGGPPTENSDFTTNINAINKREKIGEEFTYLIIGSQEGTVWGDKIYTDDSNIAKAAVLEGKCKIDEETFVRIKMVEGKSSYSSSFKNGINSSSWGSWPASYIFI
jgi:hypothetical protein